MKKAILLLYIPDADRFVCPEVTFTPKKALALNIIPDADGVFWSKLRVLGKKGILLLHIPMYIKNYYRGSIPLGAIMFNLFPGGKGIPVGAIMLKKIGIGKMRSSC